jgi:hypothetical protein
MDKVTNRVAPEPQQLDLVFEAGPIWNLDPTERLTVIVALVGLLLEAAGLSEEQDDEC